MANFIAMLMKEKYRKSLNLQLKTTRDMDADTRLKNRRKDYSHVENRI